MRYAAVRHSGRLSGLFLPAACICGIAYFVYHTLSGQYGLLALPLYQEHTKRLKAQSESLSDEIAILRNRLSLLNPNALDPDLAEELARQDLGYVRPDEVLIPLIDD